MTRHLTCIIPRWSAHAACALSASVAYSSASSSFPRFQRDVGEGDVGLDGAVFVATAAEAKAEAIEERALGTPDR